MRTRASASTGCGSALTSNICCPSDFFCDEFARRIDANRAHEKQRWIFDLIAGNAAPKEEIFLDGTDWMLVLGSSYSAPDVWYFVIFKDLTLHTIRDLRLSHVEMLKKLQREVRLFLQANHSSVFQLHLHVCGEASADRSRTQLLSCEVRNLLACDTWYKDALILFSPPRVGGPRRAVAAATVAVAADKRDGVLMNPSADKPDGVCI
jgi:hypothetical protein